KMPAVVSAAPTMVTNMTGFLIIRRGLSFLKASTIAGPAMFQSKREGAVCFIRGSKKFSLEIEKMLNHRSQREGGQKIQRTNQEHRPDQQDKKRATVNWKS